MEIGRLQPISWDKTDQLRDELRGYEQEAVLLDGITAADSLARVVNAPKISDEPRIVSSGLYQQSSQGQLEIQF